MRNLAKAKIASKAEHRAPFEINGKLAVPGKLTQVELKVSRLPTGMWMGMWRARKTDRWRPN